MGQAGGFVVGASPDGDLRWQRTYRVQSPHCELGLYSGAPYCQPGGRRSGEVTTHLNILYKILTICTDVDHPGGP